MLILYNKIKETGEIPEFMKTANIAAIYKGKGDKTDLDSDRGIFLVSVFRTILMKMIYKDLILEPGSPKILEIISLW